MPGGSAQCPRRISFRTLLARFHAASLNSGTTRRPQSFTLLTPLEDYATTDFQLLYEDSSGEMRQYRYRAGEAIVLASHFMHSTEPGAADPEANGRPHVFLCFTFGSDKAEHWPAIAPVINGYQSRFLHRFDGVSELTQIGAYLEGEGAPHARVRCSR